VHCDRIKRPSATSCAGILLREPSTN